MGAVKFLIRLGPSASALAAALFTVLIGAFSFLRVLSRLPPRISFHARTYDSSHEDDRSTECTAPEHGPPPKHVPFDVSVGHLEVGRGGVLLRATDGIEQYDDEAMARVFRALAPALPSGRPRQLPVYTGLPAPRLVYEDAADYQR